MIRLFKLAAISASVALAMLCAAPALAGGTAPGTDVLNNITASFDVGGVTQTSVSASDTFKIDRKVIFSLVEAAPTGTTTVGPGQTAQVTRFQLTNTSNDTLDFSLGAFNLPTGTNSPHGGQDSFDVTPFAWVDVNGNGTYESATDNAWYVDNLAPDTSRFIFVVTNIPSSVTVGQTATVHLFATARDPSGSPANVVSFNVATDSTANGANTVETVFADVAKTGLGGASIARDGVDKAIDSYTVVAPTLSVFKSSRVVSDGVSSNNSKAVPSAVVEYCISVENASGGSPASNITISDMLPPNITYVPTSIRINGTVTTPGVSQICSGGTAISDSASDADGGSFGSLANTVEGSLANLNGGNASALIFRATVN
ncbi:hypothetical protein [Sphingorhabdus sp.]|uniref:hypothetical protein n=1 Tax=Sphingorhabdus sp. TaxID=1902408 RepID=UPI00391D7BFE